MFTWLQARKTECSVNTELGEKIDDSTLKTAALFQDLRGGTANPRETSVSSAALLSKL
jgi:hypothetical protein